MQDVALEPHVVELVGLAALPVVEFLDSARHPALVARDAHDPLAELSSRGDVPDDIARIAQDALASSRRVTAGDRSVYPDFLRATHRLLVAAGLPAPMELSASD